MGFDFSGGRTTAPLAAFGELGFASPVFPFPGLGLVFASVETGLGAGDTDGDDARAAEFVWATAVSASQASVTARDKNCFALVTVFIP